MFSEGVATANLERDAGVNPISIAAFVISSACLFAIDRYGLTIGTPIFGGRVSNPSAWIMT